MGLTGVLADRYAIECEIARGGMATVYLARDLRHGSRVAVKVLHPDIAPLIGEARFNREIQVTARLQHPNILPVLDSGRVDGLSYYVTPYVDGESLAHRMERDLQLPIDDAVSIAIEVADALALAHAEGLVHRDIKPGNILLAHGHAIVADFGIAQLTVPKGSAQGAAEGAEKLTQRGVALGTAAYMSPEQSAGGTVDGRSDIYSLGCVLYEMLSGQQPFSGINAQAVMARHMIDTVPLLRPVRPTVSVALEKVIHKAMAKAPADRFVDAAQFRDAIRAAGTALTTVPEHPRRRYTRIAMIVTAAVVVIGGLLLLTSHITRLGARSTAVVRPDQSQIAVMYFDDNSPNRDMGYLANGLTESLIRELSAVPAIHVISRNGVRPYRDHPVGLDSLATALHVGSVVEGSVQRSGDKVRVTVDLLDAATGGHLDSRTIEQPAGDLFALEDDVVQQVAELLRKRLGEAIRLREVQEGTTSAAARVLLLRADNARDQAATITTRAHSGDAADALAFLAQSDSLLVQAESADPRWIQPVIARGWVMLDVADLSTGSAQERALRNALARADDALRIAPRNAYALDLHGTALWRLAADAPNSTQNDQQLRLAEQNLRSAVAIRPGLASAWSMLSKLLRFKGSLAEANAAAQRALAEDAYLEDAPDVLEQLYRSQARLGDYTSAAQSCERGRQRFPADWRFVECRLTLMLNNTANAPDPKLASRLVVQLENMDPQPQGTYSGHAYEQIFRRMVAATIMARAGVRDSARAVIAWARRAVASDSSASIDLEYDEAATRMALGEPEVALRLLSEYLEARPTLRSYIARDPLFTALRSDARFKAIAPPPRE
ncbi:MAG: protein kinase domain-containing protein [Gemmatimonadaceae bacterium]